MDEVIKLILKNINPQMASQLRSNGVTTVDGLVRLGQQLRKRHGKPATIWTTEKTLEN